MFEELWLIALHMPSNFIMSCLYSDEQKNRQSVFGSSVCIPRDLCLVVSLIDVYATLFFVRL